MPTSFFPRSAIRASNPASQWRPLALAACLLLAGGQVHAQQNQSMEERLRAQLRITTSQLQQAQNELAAIKAAGPAAKPDAGGAAPSKTERDSLQKDLERSQAQLSAERQAREKLNDSVQKTQQQAQAAIDKANAQVAQYRGAYDELLKMARASEAERQRLAGDTALQHTAVAQCEAKNAQLYSVGQEVLRAYETVDFSTVLATRQPFAAQSRVKYEQIAQAYGDKLYEGRFDARSVAPAAPAGGAAPEAGTQQK